MKNLIYQHYYIMDYEHKYHKYKIKYTKLKFDESIHSTMSRYVESNELLTNQYGGIRSSADKYTILSEIGHGMMGSVYLVKDIDSKKYAMKIEHVFKKDIKESYLSHIWREIEFAKFMHNKYPEHFMELYDNWIDSKCAHIQDWSKIGMDIKKLPLDSQIYYNKLFASKYCAVKIWSLIDLTLKDLIGKGNISEQIYYDLFLQALYVLWLVHKEGYLHGDWKLDNIGLVKTSNKYINILGHQVKTHGYIAQLIDYGGVIHKKYNLKGYWRKILGNKNDLYFMFDRYNHNMIFNFKKFELEYKVDTWNEIEINQTDQKILEKYLPPKLSRSNKHILSQYVYKIFYWDKFEKQLVENKSIKTIPPLLRLPLETIRFMIAHINDIDSILEYMLEHRQK
jgi:serine/threonine protein kinase